MVYIYRYVYRLGLVYVIKGTFCHNIFSVAKDPKHIIENYMVSTGYLLLLSKKYWTWQTLKMSSTFLKYPRSFFLQLALVVTVQLLTLWKLTPCMYHLCPCTGLATCRLAMAAFLNICLTLFTLWAGSKLLGKRTFRYVWGHGAVVHMQRSGFVTEEGQYCTPHLEQTHKYSLASYEQNRLCEEVCEREQVTAFIILP